MTLFADTGASLVDCETLVIAVTSVAASVTLTGDAVVALSVHRSATLDITDRDVEDVMKMLSTSLPSSLLLPTLSPSTESTATYAINEHNE